MDRTVNKAKTFEEARAWDVEQNIRMTPNERMQVASEIKRRAYPEPNKDVREWHLRK